MSGDRFANSLNLLYTYGVVERIRNTLSSGDVEGLEGFRGRMDECLFLFANNYPRLMEYIYSRHGVSADEVVISLFRIRNTAYEVEDLLAVEALSLQEVPAITPQELSDLFPGYKKYLPLRIDSIIYSIINQLWEQVELLLLEWDPTDTVVLQPGPFVSYPYRLCAPSLHRMTEGRGASCRYYGEIWSLPDGETIVGLDSKKEEIIQWIFNYNPSNQCPKSISIQGEAGAGKTTLAKMIYNDVAFQASPSFDLLLWALPLPFSLDIRATLVELIRSLSNQSRSDLQRMKVQRLKSTLHDILAGKKYLLVLDDYREVVGRELLNIILNVGLAGSTVILVSAEQVSEATKRWELPRLPERDSWSLFARCAGFDEEGEKDDPSFMTRIGRSINENCYGCPQAIKTLGSLLLNNRDEIYWRGVKARSIWSTLNERNTAARNAFNASVEQMPADLLHCLFVSSILSNSRVMPMDQLIFSWMALGMLHSRDEIRDPFVIGKRYCDELASRCFLQLFQRDGLPMVLPNKQAASYPSLLIPTDGRYLIWRGDGSYDLAANFSSVRTFQFQKHVGTLSKHFRRELISRMKHVRVLLLDGSEFAKLPKNIGTLKLLKYLSVAGNAKFRALPKSICSLPNLQTLDLSGCYRLQTLPQNMHKLVSLRHLYLSTSLTKLPELPWASLHHLRICSSPKLSSLPEQIPPLSALKVLQIHDCPEIASLPGRFLGGLPSLQEISILNCDLLDLTNWSGLRVLMRLEYLQIQGLPKLINFPEGLHSVAHSLQHFVVSNCQSLTSLPEDLRRCRNLVEMVIENCSNLATLPKGIHEMNVQVLKIINCPKLITTVYVGKIATTVENDFMLSLLQFCGAVKSWKRPQDPSNGTPKAFGFCEFESAEGALRAVRLLSKVNIDGQELVLNVAKKKETPNPTEIEEKGTKEGEMTKVEKTEGDEKTEQPKPGEEELRVKHESGSKDDDTSGLLSDEDREADREATEKIANTIEEWLRNRKVVFKKDPSELQDTDVLREVSVVGGSGDPRSIFLLLPEDYEIEQDKLIQLWMAAGWINDEQHGDKLFSSFFQTGYLSHCSSNLKTGKARYKIVAQKIKAFHDRQKGNPKSIRHLSLGCNAEIDAKTFKAIEMFTQLRTLLFLGNRDHGAIQIPRHLFSVFNHLATLDLSGTRMKELPSSIEHIRGLRYLDLSWTLIEWLPNILCTLVQLQTLKLRGCYNLTVLPENLHQLTKLRHLDFDVLGQLETMPPKMGELVDLRTLPAFLVGTGDGRKITELNKVNSLSGELCIANLENVENGDEAKAAALTYKEHLKTLELRWTSSEICGMHDNSEDILDQLEPSTELEELKITCYEGEYFPGWIEDPDFCNLTSIVLYRCENLLYVPVVEQLPKLKHLRLVRMNSVKEIVNEQEQRNYAAFPNLEKLEIDEMQSLVNWDWKNSNEGDFSSLSHLIIEDCPELARFDVVSHLPSIRHFEIRNCPKLETLSDRKLPDSLEELIVDDCPPLQQRLVEGGEDWHKIEHVPNKSISEVDEDEWITDTSD